MGVYFPDQFVKVIEFKRSGGFVPVVVVKRPLHDLAMVDFANKKALQKTIQTKKAHFWSRMERKVWQLKDHFGSSVRVDAIRHNCSFDALLYIVTILGRQGHVCPHGDKDCFYSEFRNSLYLTDSNM